MDLGEVGVCSYNKNALSKILKELIKNEKTWKQKKRGLSDKETLQF